MIMNYPIDKDYTINDDQELYNLDKDHELYNRQWSWFTQ